MPETREIIVTIRNQAAPQAQTAGAPGKPAETQPSQPTSGSGTVSTGAKDRQQELTTIMVQLGERALKQAADFAVQASDYYIQRSFYLKDDYIGQRNYNIAKNAISGIASDMATIGTWTAMGGVAGFAVGTIITAGKRIFEYSKSVEMQNYAIKQMDATLQFNRQRAGYSLSSGSVGENL